MWTRSIGTGVLIAALFLGALAVGTMTGTSAYFQRTQITGPHLVSTWHSYLWCQTTQSDFNAGNLTNVSTLLSPGNVTLANVTNCTGWYCPWNYRKKITIDRTRVAATQTNFPVLINLATDADLASSAQANGNDILFTSSDGTTKLNHEIEKFTVSNGGLIAWVRIPSLSSTTNTDLYMYFNNSGAANQQNAAGVWDTNFKGVWHLKEDPSGTAPQMRDSTSNANHGTSGGTMTTSDQVAAKINGGLDFDGSNDYVSTNYVQTAVTAYTIEAWINTSTTSLQTVIVHDRGSFLNNGAGLSLTLSIGGTYPGSGNGAAGDVAYGVDSNNIYIGRYSTTTVNNNNWHHLVGVWTAPSGTAIDPAQFSIYIDGNVAATTAETTGSATSPLTGLNGTQIARHQPWGTYLPGILDEIRISNSTRPATWILTEYRNQNSPSTFYTVGAKETLPSAYAPFGTIASAVFYTTFPISRWDLLAWDNATVSGTNITFQVRASNTLFDKNATAPPWINASWPSPVLTVLPSGSLPTGNYLQWRANLTTTDTTKTPILNEVRVWYSDP
jgi:hypothetical protein